MSYSDVENHLSIGECREGGTDNATVIMVPSPLFTFLGAALAFHGMWRACGTLCAYPRFCKKPLPLIGMYFWFSIEHAKPCHHCCLAGCRGL